MSFLSKLLGGGKPRQPKIEKDSLASISTAKILYGLAEGEISGLVDGAKSIKLDDTPLLNDAGQPNFVDDKEKLAVKWDFRSGSNNQEYIQGFPDVANEKSVGVQLRQATPYVKQINDINLSAIVVRVSFGALRNQKTNGDITGTTVKYRIDLMTDNGAYQTVIDGDVTAKTSAKYERSHRIDLPKAKNGWLVKVTRITPDSTSDLLSNSMSVEAITEIIDVKLAYPNTAMLGIQYDARTFSNIAKLSVRCRGKLLSIPSNYDPVGRTYNGIWDGTFKTAYSNNPAWVFYDICLNWRYGLGRRLDASMIDKWALYQIARYCDEMVSDGLGGQEPRFAVNVYLQSQQDAFTVLQSLSSIFRGMAYWNGEQVTVAMDAPQTPVYTFSRANVVDGIFNYTGTRARDRHTVAKVAWDNPKSDFKTEYEFVRDEYAIAKYGINQLDINMMGCTSQGQAQRAGLWALKSEQLENRQVSFSIGLDGMLERIKPSAIIAISDEVFAGRANGGRIVTISGDKKTITLDRAVTANVGDTLVINNSDGVAERQTISAINGADITVSVAFDKPEAQHIWAIDSPNLRLMLFKIISIKQNDDLTHTITAIQHEPQKYAAVDSGAYVQPQRVSVVEPNIVAAPEAVAIGQFERQIQGQTVVTMTIGWTQVKDAVSYIVEFKRDDGNWVKLAPQGGLSVDVEGVYAGNYLARVTAVNAYDLQSMPKTSMLTAVVGKLGTPPSLASLKATGILFGMQLDWLFAQGSSDTNYTEIQVASAPDTNVALLGTYAYPTNTATINGLQGNLTQYYRGRIVDKLGNASPWTAWVSGTTSADASKVLDLLGGQITESQLYKDLGAKIEKIATIEDGLSNEITDRTNAVKSINDALSAEVQNRINAINATNTAIDKEIDDRQAAISTEITERQNAVKSVNDALSSEVQNRLNAESAINASIASEQQTRADADSALSHRVDSVVATAGDNKALIVTEQTARANADSALSSRIDTVVAKTDNNTSAIVSEQNARTSADNALSSRIDTVSATTSNNTALIQSEQQARADGDSVNAQRIDGVYAQINPQLAGSSNDLAGNDAIFAGVWSEQSARIEGDTALGIRIDNVASNWGNSLAAIQTENKTQADQLTALAQRVDIIQAAQGGNISLIMDSYYTKAQSDTVIANGIEKFKADYVNPQLNLKASAQALSDTQTQVTNINDKLNIASSKLDGVFAQVNPPLAGSDGELAGNDSILVGVWSEISARIEDDTALGQRIDALNVSMNGNAAAISTLNKVVIDADTALSQRIDSLNSDYQGNKASVNNQLSTLSNATNSQASSISGLQASVNTAQSTANTAVGKADNAQSAANTANTAVQSEQKARADADGALGKRIDTVIAKADSNAAAIASEQTARVNADSALSSRIDTVQSTVGSNTASIQTQQKSINGLSAQWTVKVDVNGRISGIGLASDNNVSDFAIRADKFYIAPPDGSGKGDSPFMVLTSSQTINGTVVPAGTYIKSAYIHDGSIDVAKIADATITSAKIGQGEIKSVNIGTAQVDTLQLAGQSVSVTSAINQTTFFDAKTSAFTDAVYLITGGTAVSVEFSLISCNPEGSGSFTVECFVNDVSKNTWTMAGTFGYYPSMFFPFLVSSAATGSTKIQIKVTSNGAKIGSAGYFLKATALKR